MNLYKNGVDTSVLSVNSTLWPEVVHSPESSFYSETPDYEAIFIVESNTTNSFFLDVSRNEYAQVNTFTIQPNDASITKDSCSVSHKDTLYFYGGSNHSNKIFKFDCDQSEPHARIKFDFVGGTCASNNNYILLCFPSENDRLCYKSKSPLPTQWWQWFTYVDFSYATHDSIALSSGNR